MDEERKALEKFAKDNGYSGADLRRLLQRYDDEKDLEETRKESKKERSVPETSRKPKSRVNNTGSSNPQSVKDAKNRAKEREISNRGAAPNPNGLPVNNLQQQQNPNISTPDNEELSESGVEEAGETARTGPTSEFNPPRRETALTPTDISPVVAEKDLSVLSNEQIDEYRDELKGRMKTLEKERGTQNRSGIGLSLRSEEQVALDSEMADIKSRIDDTELNIAKGNIIHARDVNKENSNRAFSLAKGDFGKLRERGVDMEPEVKDYQMLMAMAQSPNATEELKQGLYKEAEVAFNNASVNGKRYIQLAESMAESSRENFKKQEEEKTRFREEAVKRGAPKGTADEKFLNALNAGAQGAAGYLVSTLEGIGNLQESFTEGAEFNDPLRRKNYAGYKIATWLDDRVKSAFPTNPDYAKSFLIDQVPRGLGQGVVQVGLIAGGGGAGMALSLGGSVMQIGSGEFNKAFDAGADMDQAFNVFVANSPMAIIENLVIGRMVARVGGDSGPLLKKMLTGGLEESVSGLVQSFYADLTAKEIYDETKKIVFDMNKAREAGVEFVVGAALQAGVETAIKGDLATATEEDRRLLKAALGLIKGDIKTDTNTPIDNKIADVEADLAEGKFPDAAIPSIQEGVEALKEEKAKEEEQQHINAVETEEKNAINKALNSEDVSDSSKEILEELNQEFTDEKSKTKEDGEKETEQAKKSEDPQKSLFDFEATEQELDNKIKEIEESNPELEFNEVVNKAKELLQQELNEEKERLENKKKANESTKTEEKDLLPGNDIAQEPATNDTPRPEDGVNQDGQGDVSKEPVYVEPKKDPNVEDITNTFTEKELAIPVRNVSEMKEALDAKTLEIKKLNPDVSNADAIEMAKESFLKELNEKSVEIENAKKENSEVEAPVTEIESPPIEGETKQEVAESDIQPSKEGKTETEGEGQSSNREGQTESDVVQEDVAAPEVEAKPILPKPPKKKTGVKKREGLKPQTGLDAVVVALSGSSNSFKTAERGSKPVRTKRLKVKKSVWKHFTSSKNLNGKTVLEKTHTAESGMGFDELIELVKETWAEGSNDVTITDQQAKDAISEFVEMNLSDKSNLGDYVKNRKLDQSKEEIDGDQRIVDAFFEENGYAPRTQKEFNDFAEKNADDIVANLEKNEEVVSSPEPIVEPEVNQTETNDNTESQQAVERFKERFKDDKKAGVELLNDDSSFDSDILEMTDSDVESLKEELAEDGLPKKVANNLRGLASKLRDARDDVPDIFKGDDTVVKNSLLDGETVWKDSLLAAAKILETSADVIDIANRAVDAALKVLRDSDFYKNSAESKREKLEDALRDAVKAKLGPPDNSDSSGDTGGGKKKRNFPKKQIDPSQTVSQEMKDALSEQARTYYPISNESTLADVHALIDYHVDNFGLVEGIKMVTDLILSNNNDYSPRIRVATGSVLINGMNQLARDAQTSQERKNWIGKTVDIAEWLSVYGTELGQGVQAFAIFSVLTPEGMIDYAKRAVRNQKKALKKQHGQTIKKAEEAFNEGVEKAAKDATKAALKSKGNPKNILKSTKEQREAKKAELKEKLKKFRGNLNTGLNPEEIGVIAEYISVLIADGVLDLVDLIKGVRKDLGLGDNVTDGEIKAAYQSVALDSSGQTAKSIADAVRLENAVAKHFTEGGSDLSKIVETITGVSPENATSIAANIEKEFKKIAKKEVDKAYKKKTGGTGDPRKKLGERSVGKKLGEEVDALTNPKKKAAAREAAAEKKRVAAATKAEKEKARAAAKEAAAEAEKTRKAEKKRIADELRAKAKAKKDTEREVKRLAKEKEKTERAERKAREADLRKSIKEEEDGIKEMDKAAKKAEESELSRLIKEEEAFKKREEKEILAEEKREKKEREILEREIARAVEKSRKELERDRVRAEKAARKKAEKDLKDAVKAARKRIEGELKAEEKARLDEVKIKDKLLESIARDAGIKGLDLTAEQEAELRRMSIERADLPEGVSQAIYTVNEIMPYMREQFGSMNWKSLATSIWYASILSGPQTQLVNLAGNTFNALGDTIALTIQRAFVNGDIGAIAAIYPGFIKGLKKGSVQFSSIIKTGNSPKKIDNKYLEVNSATDLEVFDSWAKEKGGLKNIVLKPWTLLKFVPRLMSAVDTMFYEGFYEAAGYDAARQEARRRIKAGTTTNSISAETSIILNNGPVEFENAMDQAETELVGSGASVRDIKLRAYEIIENNSAADVTTRERQKSIAEFGTFNYDPEGTLGVLSDLISQASRKAPPLRLLVPFTRVVANVLNQQIDYIPVVGHARALGWTPSSLFNYGRGFRYTKDRELRDRQLVKATLGGAALMGIAAMVAMGEDEEDPDFSITGKGPSDSKRRKQLMAAGWKPYSVKVGNKYVSYQYTPLGLGLTLVGNYFDHGRYKNGTEEEGVIALAGQVFMMQDALMEMSFLNGINRFYQSAVFLKDNPEKRYAKILQRLLSPTITVASPFGFALLSQIDKAANPTVYDTDGLRAGLMRLIPFVRSANKPQLNALGEEVKRGGGKARFVTSRFVDVENPDPIWRMVAEKRVFIPIAGKGSKIEGEVITGDQHYNYAGEVARRMKTYLEENLKHYQDGDEKWFDSQISADWKEKNPKATIRTKMQKVLDAKGKKIKAEVKVYMTEKAENGSKSTKGKSKKPPKKRTKRKRKRRR